VQGEDRSYIYEKAEQLAAEAEEFLNEARWYSGVESKDALDLGQIAGCLEEAYKKIEGIEELIDSIMEDLNNNSGININFEMAADMLEELKASKATLYESLDMLDKEDWHVEELAEKINDVYVNFDFEAIEPTAGSSGIH
jgi:lipopolysaccharide biosynthesis regulator YciM